MPVRERNTENNYGMNTSLRVRNPSARPCRFFIQGRCRYGNQCRFSHNIASRNNRSDDTSSLNVLIDGEPQTVPQRQDSTTGTSSIASMASIPRDYAGRNFHQSESEDANLHITDSEANSDGDDEDDDDDNVIIHQGNLGFDVDSDEFGGFGPSWIHHEGYQDNAFDNIFRHMGIVSVSSSDDSDDHLSDVDSHMTLSSMGSHRAGIILGGFGDGQAEPEPNNDPARVSLNEITSFGSRLESEIKSFGGRVESTIKALQAENKALKEENSNLQEMIEGKDQSKLSILKCAICMEFKKLETFIINSPCGHCFCETCSGKVRGDKCPTCRKPITQKTKIFTS